MSEPNATAAIVVDFMGPVLRPPDAEREVNVVLRDDLSVRALLVSLGYEAGHLRALGVFRDGRRLPLSAALADGENVTISVPFGGG